MTVTYILWVVLECITFSVMVASSGESSGGARRKWHQIFLFLVTKGNLILLFFTE